MYINTSLSTHLDLAFIKSTRCCILVPGHIAIRSPLPSILSTAPFPAVPHVGPSMHQVAGKWVRPLTDGRAAFVIWHARF